MAVLINIISQIILKVGACQRINNENQNTTPIVEKSLNALMNHKTNQLSAHNRVLTL
ncbi:hypothetical protein NP493_1412g00015 [Ridgeia piscesae]|uniref:Uncharacterized protein n=1 Tax=Ridgeia piscesae TaxID=27915 RepID=A0AAD9NC03_RIDPI|nr:hypothetical protein NP493_1412g00015 [Ridgeia piscesae]